MNTAGGISVRLEPIVFESATRLYRQQQDKKCIRSHSLTHSHFHLSRNFHFQPGDISNLLSTHLANLTVFFSLFPYATAFHGHLSHAYLILLSPSLFLLPFHCVHLSLPRSNHLSVSQSVSQSVVLFAYRGSHQFNPFVLQLSW